MFTFNTYLRAKALTKDNLIQNEEKKKNIYREIFLKINDAFLMRFNSEKKHLSCSQCKNYSTVCKHSPKNPTEKLPKDCIYKFWQEKCLYELETTISNSIIKEIKKINQLRNKYTCQKCAACCKLASSEYSYEQLKERAQNGDIFSKQFISIFVPYKNKESARKVYPEFFDLLETKYKQDEQIYFYYCPKLDKNDLCTDYENRPDICRDFPNNPLVIFPKSCGYRQWQDEVDVKALTIHAMVEITEFYKEKISIALKD